MLLHERNRIVVYPYFTEKCKYRNDIEYWSTLLPYAIILVEVW